MTTSAVSPEVALVNVIAAMTTDAIGGQRSAVIHRPNMTLCTGQIRMGPIEFESRLQRVIEYPYRPGHRRMTGAALQTERRVMNIIVEMTIDALRRSVGEPLRRMAGIALDFGVFADQRKKRQSVIEAHADVPPGFVVALFASFAKLRLVRIVINMTRMAIARQRRFMHRRDMAIAAHEIEMTAEQSELRIPPVIECDL